jgi:protein-S-isoprenylcysteine O-methyltransferase Ste14
MPHIESPRGLSATGVGPLFVLMLLPLLVAATVATLLWPEVTRFPTRPNAPFVAAGLVWLTIGVAFWAATVRRFLHGFRRGELITDGTFAWCRNPIYASLVIFLLPGVALLAETWTFLAVAVLGGALIPSLVRREERDLARVFGADWDAHAAHTGRLLPLPRGRWRRRAALVWWALAAVVFLYVGALRAWHLGWGATAEEMTRALPGDGLVQMAQYRSTHAIAIGASPDRVWSWLARLGWDKGGLYSYEWLENLFGCQMTNADRIVAAWQNVKEGDAFLMDRRIPALEIAVVQPPHGLVIYGGPDSTAGPAAAVPRVIWQFVVEPAGQGGSRLIVRWQSRLPAGFFMELFNKTLLEPVHFMMEERLLRAVKERAER